MTRRPDPEPMAQAMADAHLRKLGVPKAAGIRDELVKAYRPVAVAIADGIDASFAEREDLTASLVRDTAGRQLRKQARLLKKQRRKLEQIAAQDELACRAQMERLEQLRRHVPEAAPASGYPDQAAMTRAWQVMGLLRTAAEEAQQTRGQQAARNDSDQAPGNPGGKG